MNTKQDVTSNSEVLQITDPPFTQALFGKVSWAWLWLFVRLYVGWTWLKAGWGKVTNPAWVGSSAGTALTGFVNNALTKEIGRASCRERV